jgi:hypothetical protein
MYLLGRVLCGFLHTHSKRSHTHVEWRGVKWLGKVEGARIKSIHCTLRNS